MFLCCLLWRLTSMVVRLLPMPWRRLSMHDGHEKNFHSFSGCSGDTNFFTPARSKRGSSSGRRSASLVPTLLVMHMGITPATAWLHARPAATSSPRPAGPRKSSATAHSSSLFPQQPRRENIVVRRLEAEVRSPGTHMFGGSMTPMDAPQEKEEPLWLGLDLSTQSLTAAVLRGDGVGGDFNEPVVLESINYEVRSRAALFLLAVFRVGLDRVLPLHFTCGAKGVHVLL